MIRWKMSEDLENKDEFLKGLEEYWKERDEERREYRKKREEEWRKKVDMYYIGATIGAIVAAIGFLLEIFGILKESGLAIGILGVLATLICAIWGSRSYAIELRGSMEEIRDDIRDGSALVVGEIKRRVNEGVKKVTEGIRKR